MEMSKKFTSLHRLLHWLMALALPILFITGFLRINWMNKNKMVSIIESKTAAIPKELMTDIAKSIREPMWQWHVIFAYVMVFSFLARIIYMIVKGIRFPNPFKGNISLSERFQGFTYLYFYLFVFISAFTGACIKQGFFPNWSDNLETIHKWGLYWFPIFIVLHFAGIVIAENSPKKGIASKMIGGD